MHFCHWLLGIVYQTMLPCARSYWHATLYSWVRVATHGCSRSSSQPTSKSHTPRALLQHNRLARSSHDSISHDLLLHCLLGWSRAGRHPQVVAASDCYRCHRRGNWLCPGCSAAGIGLVLHIWSALISNGVGLGLSLWNYGLIQVGTPTDSTMKCHPFLLLSARSPWSSALWTRYRNCMHHHLRSRPLNL